MIAVWLFPGQGAQKVGMGQDLAGRHPVARALFEQADQALQFSLSDVCFNGPEEELRRTAITQPALLTCSVAAASILREAGHEPLAVAGHSLGEYSALVTAGVLTFEDAVKLVHLRGRFMQEAVPEGEGAMAAVLGLEADVVAEVCARVAGAQVVQPANLNAPGQVVISGHQEAVERAISALKEAGARRAVPLDVSAPFHCPLMEPAAQKLSASLEQVPMADARVPVWTNVDAGPTLDAETLRASLVRQVASPVRWEETLRNMGAEGHAAFLEVGPGAVLTGLVRRTLKTATTRAAGSADALAAILSSAP